VTGLRPGRRQRPPAAVAALPLLPLMAMAAAVMAATAAPARAQQPPPAYPYPAYPYGDPGAPAGVPEAMDLPPSNVELDERLDRTEELVLRRQPSVSWDGYIDFGFFATGGNGSGYIQDFGHAAMPQYAGQYGWVFLGDILAPVVNSRGEAADLGDAPGVDRFDSVHSRGAPGFIINEANVTLHSALRPNALVTASVNLVPRTGNDFRLGDVFDMDLAQLEWLPTESQRTSIFVGKMESVLGIEYRERKANRRFGITPSLIARYTTGTALGLKLRTKFGSGDWLVLAGAVTNGSNVVEQFHFHNEVDSNAGKTASGRLALRIPSWDGWELGVSGSWGAQDRALASTDVLWFAGVDLMATLGPIGVKAEWLTGRGPGNEQDAVYGLDLDGGGYLELDFAWQALGLIVRGEFRDADVWLGSERLYVTKSWRATFGARWTITDQAVIKAEYLHNGEYGGLPQVANDVFTSSLVLSY
jgi:hypothetical protein